MRHTHKRRQGHKADASWSVPGKQQQKKRHADTILLLNENIQPKPSLQATTPVKTSCTRDGMKASTRFRSSSTKENQYLDGAKRTYINLALSRFEVCSHDQHACGGLPPQSPQKKQKTGGAPMFQIANKQRRVPIPAQTNNLSSNFKICRSACNCNRNVSCRNINECSYKLQ